MRKSVILSMAAMMFMLAACGSSGGGESVIGLGHSVSNENSKSAEENKAGVAQTDAIFCAASFDKDGKVLAVKFDSAQVKVVFDSTGKINSELSGDIKTKMDLGADYGLKKASSIGREWNEQISELEKWMTGKSVSEIMQVKTREVDEEHTRVPDSADLNTKVTIDIGAFLDALKMASDHAHAG